MPISPTYLHKRCQLIIFLSSRVPGLALVICTSRGLCGIGPALAGNVGTGSTFARPRDGAQDVDVPMLAPPRSRCRCVGAQEGSGEVRRSECPNGAPHTSPG